MKITNVRSSELNIVEGKLGMEYGNKAKKIHARTKSPWEVHPYKTISISDLNWLIETITKLEKENKRLQGVYEITNSDWKRLHSAISEIANLYQDTKTSNEAFVFEVGEILKKYRDNQTP